MEKHRKNSIGLFFLIFVVLISACGTKEPIKESVFDEDVYDQEFDLYRRLDEKFKGKQKYESKKDPEYEIYEKFMYRGYYSVSSFYRAKEERWANVYAAVDFADSKITFDDGTSVRFEKENRNNPGQYNGNQSNYRFYDDSGTFREETLLELVRKAEKESEERRSKHTSKMGKGILLAILFAGAGLFVFFNPKSYWFVSRGIYYKDAEPSKFALNAGKGLGIALIVIGGVFLVLSL